MSIKRADISLSRSGTNLTVTLDNFESGDTWNIYMAEDLLTAPSKVVSDHDQASYVISNVSEEINPVISVSLNNAPVSASVVFVEDHTDEDPPYYVIEEKEEHPITPNLVTIPVSWGADLTDLQFYKIGDALTEWESSGPQISIGKHQTL